eukprot:NODE_608_length_1565_cov_70.843008_g500_i0.p1 GENE.NODE_608_length_1565_cov_70.843008_g500_i0~~NODE_608_length_1565_cov_70.843008_g500_i0.p1  ORF type:complete len:232 (+),score=51.14 NODE_608_length_1565_cov_70.843008_g500_i0:765-1460(+)
MSSLGADAGNLETAVLQIVDSFREVPLLFADVVSFTSLSSMVTPETLVESLNTLITEIDKKCTQYHIEKVKTIGDCYMAINRPLGEDPSAVTEACAKLLQLATYVHQVAPRVRMADTPLIMRAGMALGPVVGGVIGTTKFAYDYWGDTVNEASRMESTGIPGLTQVSQPIFALLQHRFTFESRGLIDVKGKGQMETYLHRPNPPPPINPIQAVSMSLEDDEFSVASSPCAL